MPKPHAKEADHRDKHHQREAPRPTDDDDARRHQNKRPPRNVRPHAPETPKPEPKGNRDKPAANKKRAARAPAGKPTGTTQG